MEKGHNGIPLMGKGLQVVFARQKTQNFQLSDLVITLMYILLGTIIRSGIPIWELNLSGHGLFLNKFRKFQPQQV